MAAAMVEGLDGQDIVLSPRGASVAADLARRFPGVTVAASNQSVVDQCDTVVLSIRPQVAEVVRALRFRPGQQVLSQPKNFAPDVIKSTAYSESL